jgi:long-chain acyl-CoA synthetase
MAESIAEFFLEHFRAHAQECAYMQRRGYRTERITYGQVLELAFSITEQLYHRAIAKGDRLLLWGENSAEWAAAFFGCALRGVVVVPMDDGASPDFVRRVCGQIGAKLVVASERNRASIADVPLPSLSFEDLRTTSRAAETYIPSGLPCRDDILQIVFTSGTTADPKGVVITHGNVLANIAPLEKEIRAYLKYERLVHPVRFLNLLPLSHVFGQFLGMFLPPLMGGTVIFQSELKPSEVMNTIRRERVTVLVSVPRVLQSLKHRVERDIEERGQADEFRRRFISAKHKHFLRRWWIFRDVRKQFGWKFWAFISGGAALDSDTEEFWGRLGYAVIQGYGLTETTSLISVNHPFRLGQGSIGKVLPGREVKLAEDGEILVRGGGVASGYWGSYGSHGVSDEQGWYRTGDLGALDEVGNLYFKGRKKEVIVTPEIWKPRCSGCLR